MELALGHIGIIFGSFAISEQWFTTINHFRGKKNKPEVRGSIRWVIFIGWFLFFELILGIQTNNAFGGTVLDFYKLYSGADSYREEKDNTIEDWSDTWDEVKRDDKGKYRHIHYLERYRIRKNENNIPEVLEEIINPFNETESDYNIRIVEDGIEIYKQKEKWGKAHLEIGTFFSYIYIEWDYIRRYEDMR